MKIRNSDGIEPLKRRGIVTHVPNALPNREVEFADALEAHTEIVAGRIAPHNGRKALLKYAGNPALERLKRFIVFTRRVVSDVADPDPLRLAQMEETVLERFRSAHRSRRQHTIAASPLPVGTDSELVQSIYPETDESFQDSGYPRSRRSAGMVGAPSASATSDSVLVHLEVDEGETVRVATVRLFEAVFGRGYVPFRIENDVQISRRHTRLFLLDGAVVVSDLESRNGTFVNGEKITEPTLLEKDSVMEIGKTRLILEDLVPMAPGYAQAVFATNKGGRYRVDLSECLIGRARNIAVPLRDSSKQLSRLHGRLDLSDGQVYLTDLDSTNGLIAEGTRIEGSIVLEPEVVFEIGSVRIRVIGFERE